MAYKKVVVESSADNIAQNAASATLAATVTTNANLTGVITSTGNATAIAAGAIAYSKLDLEDSIAAGDIPNGLLALGKLSAGGTASGTTFLRGDNTWATPTDISTVANLTDTTISGTPSDNEVLAYDTSASKWINQTLVEAGIQPTLGGGDVALSNMASLAANTFIGRDTESTGAPEALSVSAVKAMLSLNSVDNTADSAKPVSSAQATSIATKALLAGDANQNFSANTLTVKGDLNVAGTTNHTSTETLLIADNTMVLNSDKTGGADIDAGIVVERGDGLGFTDNKSLYWDEGSDKWKFATSTGVDVGGTYNGDVVSQYNTGTYDGSNNTVPVGHFQWDGTNLYVRSS